MTTVNIHAQAWAYISGSEEDGVSAQISPDGNYLLLRESTTDEVGDETSARYRVKYIGREKEA